MPLTHRYLNELNLIEEEQVFCGQPINVQSNILIIGTFNPSNNSCLKQNNSTWFYGRNKSNFWRYFPTSLTGVSMHPLDNHIGYPNTWKNYCVENKIVIIDLIKEIQSNNLLENFGDKNVNDRISENLANTTYFNINNAFNNIKFNRVIYSLKWTEFQLHKLISIRDIVSNQLINCGCIDNLNQIKYSLTPSRNDQKTIDSWNDGVNG